MSFLTRLLGRNEPQNTVPATTPAPDRSVSDQTAITRRKIAELAAKNGNPNSHMAAAFGRNAVRQTSTAPVVLKMQANRDEESRAEAAREEKFMARFNTFKDNPRIQVDKLPENEGDVFVIGGLEDVKAVNAQLTQNARPVQNTEATTEHEDNKSVDMSAVALAVAAKRSAKQHAQRTPARPMGPAPKIPVGTPVSREAAQGKRVSMGRPVRRALPATPNTPPARPLPQPPAMIKA